MRGFDGLTTYLGSESPVSRARRTRRIVAAWSQVRAHPGLEPAELRRGRYGHAICSEVKA